MKKNITLDQLISLVISHKAKTAALCQKANLLVINSSLNADQYQHLYDAHEALKKFIIVAKEPRK